MIYTLAITGSIGAGKTEVTKYLNALGVTIIDADDITHNILTDDLSTIKSISSHFGEAILSENGSIDRKKLREIVFKNSDEKAWLENILHPLIRKKIREMQKKADRESQIVRVISRDNVEYEEAERIIEDQEVKNDLESDYIINNNGSIKQLEQEIKKLQKVIMKTNKD